MSVARDKNEGRKVIKQLCLTYKSISPFWRFTIYAITFLLISGGTFLTLYLSKIDTLRSIQSEINKVEGDILKGKQLQARCKLPTEDEKKAWSEIKKNFFRRIPPEKKLLQLVKDIAKIAHDCSIYDISFAMPHTPRNSSSKNNYKTISSSVTDIIPDPMPEAHSISLDQSNEVDLIKLNQFSIKTSFHCRYQDLSHFLNGISTLPRVLAVSSLKIERKLPLMEVEMSINAFYAEGREDA